MGFHKIAGFTAIAVLIASVSVASAAEGSKTQTAADLPGSIGILGGLAVTGASLDTGIQPNTLSGSSQASYKLGLAGEYEVIPLNLSVELDLLYASYKWEQNTTGMSNGTDYSSHWLEIPLFFNYTGIEMFKFGMGPVFDFANGDIHVQNSDGSNALNTSYSSVGLGSSSVGLGFQAGMHYPLDEWVNMPLLAIADIRYVTGLTNLSQVSPQSTKIHSFDFLVGLGFAF